MPLDVSVSAPVQRPPADVVAFLRDPANDPQWIGGIVEVHPPDEPLAVGVRVPRVASFMRRRIDYVLEVERIDERDLVMRSVEAPFPMRVSYRVDAEGAGDASRVTLRVENGPGGLARLFTPVMAWQVRRNLRGDLRRLGAILGR